MKFKAFIPFLLLTLCLPQTLKAQDEDSRYAPLDSLLAQFYVMLEAEPMEVKEAEMDSIIDSCTDSLARQHVCLEIFDHYRYTRLMGEEEVAVHVFDRYLADDTIRMKGDFDKFDAQMFADFNRSTLLGMQAPVLTFQKPCGGKAEMPAEGRCSIIYFHDTSCSKCRLTAKLLPSVVDSIDFKCNLYLIYCGSDAKAWRGYRREMKFHNRNVKVTHLWDPENETSYQRTYGVISTPRMYMTEPQGCIIGRRLELDALKQLLPYAAAMQETYEKYR